jgi:hypothetical protein
VSIQKAAYLVLAGLCSIRPGQPARRTLANARYAVVAYGHEKINRSGAFATTDAKRITLFQSNVLIFNIQRYFPPKKLC